MSRRRFVVGLTAATIGFMGCGSEEPPVETDPTILAGQAEHQLRPDQLKCLVRWQFPNASEDQVFAILWGVMGEEDIFINKLNRLRQRSGGDAAKAARIAEREGMMGVNDE